MTLSVNRCAILLLSLCALIFTPNQSYQINILFEDKDGGIFARKTNAHILRWCKFIFRYTDTKVVQQFKTKNIDRRMRAYNKSQLQH